MPLRHWSCQFKLLIDPPSYWYNLLSNIDGSLCQLLLLKECIFLSILIKYGLIRRTVVCGEMTTIIRNDQWTSFNSAYELVNSESNKSKVDALIQNKLVRRKILFIRTGNKNYLSFLKASKQYSTGHPPPVINTCLISRIFLEFVTVNISDSVSWNKCINGTSLKRNEVRLILKKCTYFHDYNN